MLYFNHKFFESIGLHQLQPKNPYLEPCRAFLAEAAKVVAKAHALNQTKEHV